MLYNNVIYKMQKVTVEVADGNLYLHNYPFNNYRQTLSLFDFRIRLKMKFSDWLSILNDLKSSANLDEDNYQEEKI